MSGPKVVRIVTREERIEAARGQIAGVEATLAEWTRIGIRNGVISDADIEHARSRLDRLRALVERDRFAEIQAASIAEIEYLREDQRARMEKFITAQAQARTNKRRQCEAATALIGAIRRAGLTPSSELEAALSRASSGEPDPTALARGFEFLSSKSELDPTARRELARKHKEGHEDRTLSSWIAAQGIGELDTSITRVERSLVEIAQLFDSSVHDGLESRVKLAAAEGDQRRELLLDSLEIEIARLLKDGRARRLILDELGIALGDLRRFDEPQMVSIQRRVANANLEELKLLVSEAHGMLASRREVHAAAARRSAVLKELAALGYVANESLQTAWVDSGRLQLRSAARPEYGVEINGNLSSGRVQIRAVALVENSVGPDPSRDKDAETIWCGDVSTMQAALAAKGIDFVIEKAKPIGAAPLERVAASGTSPLQAAYDIDVVRQRLRDI